VPPRSSSLPQNRPGAGGLPPATRPGGPQPPNLQQGTGAPVRPGPGNGGRPVPPQPGAKTKRTEEELTLEKFDRALASIATLLKREGLQVHPDERAFLEDVLKRGGADRAGLAGKFPDLDAAVKLSNRIRVRRELPATSELEKGQSDDSQVRDRMTAELAELRRHYNRDPVENGRILANLEHAEKLIKEGKFQNAQTVLDAAQPRLDSARETELMAPGFVPQCVLKVAGGQFDEARSALDDLTQSKTALSPGQRNKVLKDMIDAVFASDAVPGQVENDPKFFAALLEAAADLAANDEAAHGLKILPNFLASLHTKLGPRNSMVCASLLALRWQSPHLMDRALYTSMIAGIDKADWNKADSSLAAKGFNMLWHAKEIDTICKLIENGVDTMQAGAYGRDTGRSREGMWSGFIQPLEHVMGNYVRLASLPDDHPDVVTVGVDKVADARKILRALGAESRTTIMTDYSEYERCEMLLGFPDDPGTIWGFEDVRLPYVQAAHDTAPGRQPLRMWEMWDAVDLALNEEGYASLLRDPEKTIRKVVAQGRAKVREGREKRPLEYYGRTTDEFLQEFEDECTSYLWFLAEQTPTAKFATAELAGRRIEKAMGGLGCKAGLWWAKQVGQPVYYCIDGMRIQDAIDYKTYKTKRINDALADSKNAKYGEVITLAEVREILTHWDDGELNLKDTVKWVRKGRILQGDELKEVDGWVARMKESDGRAPARQAPPVKVFRDRLDKLDPTLVWSLDRKQSMQVVNKVELIKLAAEAEFAEKLLPEVLDDCKVLFDFGLLPADLADAFRTMFAAGPDGMEIGAETVKARYLRNVCDELAIPLTKAIDRWMGTAMQPFVAPKAAEPKPQPKVEQKVEV
jgi:hypothetical protein